MLDVPTTQIINFASYFIWFFAIDTWPNTSAGRNDWNSVSQEFTYLLSGIFYTITYIGDTFNYLKWIIYPNILLYSYQKYFITSLYKLPTYSHTTPPCSLHTAIKEHPSKDILPNPLQKGQYLCLLSWIWVVKFTVHVLYWMICERI